VLSDPKFHQEWKNDSKVVMKNAPPWPLSLGEEAKGR
jgi:hypothetical protein